MLDIRPIAGTPRSALEAARGASPYLSRLTDRYADVLDRLNTDGPNRVLKSILSDMRGVGAATDDRDVQSRLRIAKAQGHMVIAGADLSGLWSLEQVTAAVTALADAGVQGALEFAVRSAELSLDGLFVIALGKMGAHELNYSSDIDIAAFYDPDRFDGGRRSPGDAASRVIRHMVRLLDERTEDGYVFRTDLRLRPDPGSTPLAVSTRMAENYYESVGQNWERMVWIKARAMAGDLAAASEFLPLLKPFVWRRHLDYWAINDIYAIKRMINASSKSDALEVVDPDVKLGPGGIREIEFFAQTQQLILGGRNRDLRARSTQDALKALVAQSIVSESVGDDLSQAYTKLRLIEHRIQMMRDAQTHKVPTDEAERRKLVALCGGADVDAFDAGLLDLRQRVSATYMALFAEEDRQHAAAEQGNFVFTGVDDDPGTVETLSKLGFSDPSRIISVIREWHRGKPLATRNPRGRQLLTALAPGLLQDMADTGEPDAAFGRFQSFFEGLRAGVQILSMLLAEPSLRADLVATLALAPRLSVELSRRPALLEALLGAPQMPEPLEGLGFEGAMDEMRRRHREQAFLIGHDLLHGHISPKIAGNRYSELADHAVASMADAAAAEMVRRFGEAPGEWLVCAMGKLGGREMTSGSDLDLIVIYDLDGAAGSGQWFTRFTQRLITALSAETGEGALYEVDMRLRPSGRAGPVAVRLSTFERYHREEAWTWERMALTRIRPVCGQPNLWARFDEVLTGLNAIELVQKETLADILDMRRRLAREKPGGGLWELKSAPGGLVDIEFVAQAGLLQLTGDARLEQTTLVALDRVAECGRMTRQEADDLKAAHTLFAGVQQIQRLALSGDVPEEHYPAGLKERLVRIAGTTDFADLRAAIEAAKARTVEIRTKMIGAIDT